MNDPLYWFHKRLTKYRYSVWLSGTETAELICCFTVGRVLFEKVDRQRHFVAAPDFFSFHHFSKLRFEPSGGVKQLFVATRIHFSVRDRQQ